MKDYSKVFRAWGKGPNATMDLGGHTVPFDKLKNAYDTNIASGGFASAEIQKSARRDLTGKGIVQHVRHPTSIPGGVRRVSETREDFGRFAHYYHAMTEEYPAALRRFKGDQDKAFAAATNSSSARVNKYKYDYGALTKAEQQVMRRGMPFYTYMRKSIPTLIESLALSPRNLVMTNKVFSTEGRDEWDAPILADYLSASGMAMISGSDDEEPWGIAGNFLPQDVFNNTFNNPVSGINPLGKLPFEIQSGKDSFSGKKVETIFDILGNNFRGKALYDKMNKDSSEVKAIEKLAAALGIPLTQVTKEKQEKQVNRDRYQLNTRIKSYNEKAEKKGFRLYLTTKNQIRILKLDSEGNSTGQPKQFATLEEAVKALNL